MGWLRGSQEPHDHFPPREVNYQTPAMCRGFFLGFAMPDSERKQTAYHEAGHAIAHLRHDILQLQVTIRPHDGNLGGCTGEGKDNVWNAAQAPDQVICYCAGYAALIAIGHDKDIALLGCSDDMDNAAELITIWSLPGTLDEWQAKAVELMSRPENIRAVDFVARALLKYKTLEPDYFDFLVEWADGHISDAEWERFISRFYPNMLKL